jgi:hypothetical protein
MNPGLRSLDQMVAFAEAHARAMLIGKPGVQLDPIFHVQFKSRPDSILAMPWRDEHQRRAIIDAIHFAIKAVRADVVNFVFLSEGWLASQDHRFRDGDLLPEKRENRREIVFIHAGDGLDTRFRVWEIVRDDQAVITELTPLPEGCDLEALAGPWCGLLED